ncbi:MAG: His Kinase (phospho-acceptor) domain, partial [Solirubrobacteraceae bacterium]|nr:His Kinase (phospho-acceptor) domain [Solirubrobacteraceae bacterium]
MADTPVSPDDNPELDRFARRMRLAEARRGALVADAGHELKTPLSIMLGLSGRLLASPDVTPAQERDLRRIRG